MPPRPGADDDEHDRRTPCRQRRVEHGGLGPAPHLGPQTTSPTPTSGSGSPRSGAARPPHPVSTSTCSRSACLLEHGHHDLDAGTTTTTLTDKDLQGPGNACTNGVGDCKRPTAPSSTRAASGPTMNTEGAANINGDAFQPYYDTATSTPAPACPTATGDRACYDADNYYNYAVEMPPGSTNGSVYVYDPRVLRRLGQQGHRRPLVQRIERRELVLRALQHAEHALRHHRRHRSSRRPARCSSRSTASDTSMGGQRRLGVQAHERSRRTATGATTTTAGTVLYTGLTGGANGTVYRLHTTVDRSVQRGRTSATRTARAASRSTPRQRRDARGSTASARCRCSRRCRRRGGSRSPSSTSPRSTRSTPARRWRSSSGTRATRTPAAQPPDRDPDLGGLDARDASTGRPSRGTSAIAERPTSCNSTSRHGARHDRPPTAAARGIYNGCWLTIDVPIPTTYTRPAERLVEDPVQHDRDRAPRTTSRPGRSRSSGNPVHLDRPLTNRVAGRPRRTRTLTKPPARPAASSCGRPGGASAHTRKAPRKVGVAPWAPENAR